jgi:hypothetical protein
LLGLNEEECSKILSVFQNTNDTKVMNFELERFALGGNMTNMNDMLKIQDEYRPCFLARVLYWFMYKINEYFIRRGLNRRD